MIPAADKPTRWSVTLAATLLWGMAVAAHAQDDSGGDGVPDEIAESTIRLMDIAEAELPAIVTKEIVLPPAAAENAAAVRSAERGLQRANERREQRGSTGAERAEAARENGAEVAEQARQNRESRGRFDDRPGRPDRPDPPEPPDPPRGPPGD